MRILFLTQIIPFPPDSGPKVKTWHVLRYLLGHSHQVTLVSFVRPEEEQYIPALRAQGIAVIAVPMHRSRVKDVGYLLRSLVSRTSFLIERDNLPEFRQAVQDQLARYPIDVIHADQLTMAQFATVPDANFQPVRVFDAHNAVWTIVERMTENLPRLLRPFAQIETKKVLHFEANTVRDFEHTLTVSEVDRNALLAAVEGGYIQTSSADKITVIPIAVDTNELQMLHRQSQSKRIVTLGTLYYPPNADGIRWFINEVFPLVLAEEPDAHLTIIGKNPPQDFLQQAQRHPEHLRVTGYIPELDPVLSEAAIMVVPVRAGGGMRVRILEAFARGIPLVTTTVGLEGINAKDGKEVLVRDEPAEFAQAVVTLLRDPGAQDMLAQAGRRLVEEVYDWQVALKAMDQVYSTMQTRQLRTDDVGVRV